MLIIVAVLFIPDHPDLIVIVATQAIGELVVSYEPPWPIVGWSPEPIVTAVQKIDVVDLIKIIRGAHCHIKPKRWRHDEVGGI